MISIKRITKGDVQVATFTTESELAGAIKGFDGYTLTTIAATTKVKLTKKHRDFAAIISAIKGVLKAYKIKDGTPITDISEAALEELTDLGGIKNGHVEVGEQLTVEAAFGGRDIYKTSTRSGYGFGDYDYAKMVNKKRKAEGNEEEFVSEAPRGRSFVEGSRTILVSEKDDSQFYIRTYKFNKGCSSKYVHHFEDGTELTDTELDLLKGFAPKPSSSVKQGLVDEVIVNDFKLDGIMYIRLGTTYICRKSYEPKLRTILNKIRDGKTSGPAVL